MTGNTVTRGVGQKKVVQIEQKHRSLTDKEERDMKLAFELYDLTGCGVITRDDALNILTTFGFKVTREDNLKLNAII
jgi:Ca2+-binding EF-hand superfamily protein